MPALFGHFWQIEAALSGIEPESGSFGGFPSFPPTVELKMRDKNSMRGFNI
jgi:hypothetical protein